MAGPEARLEAACCRHAKKHGCWALKLWPLITGLPDRLFLLPGGRVWFVEFKAPDGRLSPRQYTVHELLGIMGFIVDVVRDADTFKHRLRWALKRL